MEQTIGKRIMSARKKLGLTQDQLAERLGVTAQAVSKWENDQSCPDITTLPKLAEIFGTTTDELLGRTASASIHETEVVEDTAHDGGNGKEIIWHTGRKASIVFAVLALLTGSLMLANALLDWGASFWDILWPSALLVFGFTGGFSFIRLSCFLLGACFLSSIIFDLHLRNGLILPIILLIFGASLLVDAIRKPKRHFSFGNLNRTPPTRNSFLVDGEDFTFNASFGEQEQLITMPRLSDGKINTNFGEYTLDFSGVEEIANGCVLEASCSFGELTLLIPKRFRVQCDSSTSFASIEINKEPNTGSVGTILLHASASFGQIEICYI